MPSNNKEQSIPVWMQAARRFYSPAFELASGSELASAMTDWSELDEAERQFTQVHLSYLNLMGLHGIWRMLKNLPEHVSRAVEEVLEDYGPINFAADELDEADDGFDLSEFGTAGPGEEYVEPGPEHDVETGRGGYDVLDLEGRNEEAEYEMPEPGERVSNGKYQLLDTNDRGGSGGREVEGTDGATRVRPPGDGGDGAAEGRGFDGDRLRAQPPTARHLRLVPPVIEEEREEDDSVDLELEEEDEDGSRPDESGDDSTRSTADPKQDDGGQR